MKEELKNNIPGLSYDETEYEEEKVLSVPNIKCENQYEKFPPLMGTFLLTTYRVKFIPIIPKEDPKNQ
jgi:hypothetical protein